MQTGVVFSDSNRFLWACQTEEVMEDHKGDIPVVENDRKGGCHLFSLILTFFNSCVLLDAVRMNGAAGSFLLGVRFPAAGG
jgi:hypothetical protein